MTAAVRRGKGEADQVISDFTHVFIDVSTLHTETIRSLLENSESVVQPAKTTSHQLEPLTSNDAVKTG